MFIPCRQAQPCLLFFTHNLYSILPYLSIEYTLRLIIFLHKRLLLSSAVKLPKYCLDSENLKTRNISFYG